MITLQRETIETISRDTVEVLAPGVTCTWLDGGRIVVIKADDSSRESVDAWADHMEKIIDEWPVGIPFISLEDLTSNMAGSTPYARMRAQKLLTLRDDLQYYIAMLMPRTAIGRLLEILVRRANRGHMHIRVMYSYDEALKWLRGAEQ